jgi:predicted phage baseplate assembly protein
VRALPAPTRAVNLLDIERLALDVPGTHIARARALPAYHPAYPGLSAPGVVTVVILPYLPAGRPQPSPGLIAVVHRYLERRRMVGSAIIVTGPEYTEVSVQAQVQLKPFAHPARTKETIRAALDRFLDPLSGGPDRLGWPFGRSVYRSEILQLIDSVPGVDHLLALALRAGEVEGQCGDLPVCPRGLVTPGKHDLTVVN